MDSHLRIVMTWLESIKSMRQTWYVMWSRMKVMKLEILLQLKLDSLSFESDVVEISKICQGWKFKIFNSLWNFNSQKAVFSASRHFQIKENHVKFCWKMPSIERQFLEKKERSKIKTIWVHCPLAKIYSWLELIL